MASKRKTMVQTMENNPRKCESSPLCWGIEIHKQYRCGSKPMIDNFSGMNIHLSVILEFTARYQGFEKWFKVIDDGNIAVCSGKLLGNSWLIVGQVGIFSYISWVMTDVPIFHITQPKSVYGLLDGYKVSNIPKMGQYQPLCILKMITFYHNKNYGNS